jgi:hypothetical protein
LARGVESVGVFSKPPVAVFIAAPLLLLTGCGRPAAAAPPTDLELRPEIIGVVVSWDRGPHGGTAYTLDTGEVVELGYRASDGTTATPRKSESDIGWGDLNRTPGQAVYGPSVLLLAGHGPDGKLWYAAAPAGRQGSKCRYYEMRAAGIYDEGSVLHFSTGLIVRKASDFSTDAASGDEAFPLNSADRLCLDEAGSAVFAEIWYPY